ncbi:MAG: spore cortex-lytic enzyme [Oscillospiraceae bacterium]|nr:spore cortex-lytic enzyme [Oscillospiraceae bacterium]
MLVIAIAQEADAAVYRRGSSGTVVTQIQTKLRAWGYLSGNADGVFGAKTELAVKSFQRRNNLTADGVAGPATLAALGISAADTSSGSARSGDVNLLARLISAEARGEPYDGQVAVGAVVLNRIQHPSFPSTMSGVIYQTGAFTCLVDGQFDKPVAESAYKAASDALNGCDPSGGAIYYFNPKTATSAWIWSRPVLLEIGRHRFCA